MKTAKRYLLYELKKSLWRTVIFTAISVFICMMVIPDGIKRGEDMYKSSGIGVLAVLLGALCSVMPVLELSDFKNRRNLDTLYFFPIERKKLGAVHFISGFIQICVIYTVSFGLSYLYLAVNTACFELWYMIPYYFLSLLVGLVIYSFFSFVFSIGNTVTDGIILCILYSILAYVLLEITRETVIKALFMPDVWDRELFVAWSENNISSWGVVYAPLDKLTAIFRNAIEVNQHTGNYVYEYTSAYTNIQRMYMFFIWGGIGVMSVIGYIMCFERRGAHMAGEPTESWFGYRVLIPLYGYSLIMYFASHIDFGVFFVMTIILMLIGYIIYRRSFRIKKSDIIVMACAIIPAILGVILSLMLPEYIFP